MQFMAPIPGQSLTTEPGNAPYEQPPLYAEPEKALAFYLQKLDDEEFIDDLMFILEQGMPVETFVNSLTSTGVMEGYHTFDVKVLIAPILHEYIVNLALAAGVEVTEMSGPSKESKAKEKDKKRMALLIQKSLDEDEPIDEESEDKAEELMGSEEGPEEEMAEMGQGIVPRRQ